MGSKVKKVSPLRRGGKIVRARIHLKDNHLLVYFSSGIHFKYPICRYFSSDIMPFQLYMYMWVTFAKGRSKEVGTTADEKEGYSVRQKCAKLYGVGKLFANLDNQSMETSQLAKSVEKKEGFCESVV
jgi:hypothetical protein